MEAKLKAAGMKVFELTSAIENMQKNNDALQRKVATPVQVQILDKSPVAAQQQVRLPILSRLWSLLVRDTDDKEYRSSLPA